MSTMEGGVPLGNIPVVQEHLTQIGFAYGRDFIQKNQGQFLSQYNRYLSTFKYYFNVNNSYVINKLKLILFPLKHKYWKRRIHRQDEAEVYLPPRDDINAPDLYIPTMAFVTYVLIIGFVMGASFRFTPEVLGATASRALVVLALEVLIIKFGFYLLNSLTLQLLDVVSYCGYKYVGIVVTILGGLLFGSFVYFTLMLVTSTFMAIFMVRTLKLVFPEVAPGPNQRNYFLAGIAALQLLIQFYLSYDTKIIY